MDDDNEEKIQLKSHHDKVPNKYKKIEKVKSEKKSAEKKKKPSNK